MARPSTLIGSYFCRTFAGPRWYPRHLPFYWERWAFPVIVDNSACLESNQEEVKLVGAGFQALQDRLLNVVDTDERCHLGNVRTSRIDGSMNTNVWHALLDLIIDCGKANGGATQLARAPSIDDEMVVVCGADNDKTIATPCKATRKDGFILAMSNG